MSFEKVVWVLNHSQVTGVDRLVLVAVASHVNGERAGRPSLSVLADEARVDRRTVTRALQRLEKEGCLLVSRQGAGRGRTNRYWVPTEIVATCHQYCCGRGAYGPEIGATEARNRGVPPPEPLRASRTTNYTPNGGPTPLLRPRPSHPEPDRGRPVELVARCPRCERLTFDCTCPAP